MCIDRLHKFGSSSFCEKIEQFVNEVPLPWWNQGLTYESMETYNFFAQSNIPSRLDKLKVREWKKNIHNMLQRIPEERCMGTCFTSITSSLYNYEYLQKDVAPILELALWKSEMEEQSNGNLLDKRMKLQCRFNSFGNGSHYYSKCSVVSLGDSSSSNVMEWACLKQSSDDKKCP